MKLMQPLYSHEHTRWRVQHLGGLPATPNTYFERAPLAHQLLCGSQHVAQLWSVCNCSSSTPHTTAGPTAACSSSAFCFSSATHATPQVARLPTSQAAARVLATSAAVGRAQHTLPQKLCVCTMGGWVQVCQPWLGQQGCCHTHAPLRKHCRCASKAFCRHPTTCALSLTAAAGTASQHATAKHNRNTGRRHPTSAALPHTHACMCICRPDLRGGAFLPKLDPSVWGNSFRTCPHPPHHTTHTCRHSRLLSGGAKLQRVDQQSNPLWA